MPPKSKKPPEQEPPAPDPDPDWQDHPAREVLRLAFWSGEIPLDWKNRPDTIYNKFKDREEFKGMPYDKVFQSRLRNLRNMVKDKINRKAVDQQAFDVFRKNFPVKEFNSVGIRRWNGTDAEAYFKEDMLEGLNVGVPPREFWASRPEYQQFPLDTFRKHIGQERKLYKLQNFLEEKDIKAKEKAEKRKKKKEKAMAAAMKKAMAKVGADEAAKAKAQKKAMKMGPGRKKETENDSESINEQLDDENEEVELDSSSSSSSSSSSRFY
jgi:hypothetical protein